MRTHATGARVHACNTRNELGGCFTAVHKLQTVHACTCHARACVRSHTGEPAEIIWNRVADAIYIFNDRGYRARLASEEGNRAEKRDGTEDRDGEIIY